MKEKVKEVLDQLKELPQELNVRSAIIHGEKFYNTLNTIVTPTIKVKKIEVKEPKSFFGGKKEK